MNTTKEIDPKNQADAALLRSLLLAAFPDAARYLHPAVNFDPHCWESAGRRGCWLALRQSAWTNDGWGWQSDEPSERAKNFGTWRECPAGGWFQYDCVSIGD